MSTIADRNALKALYDIVDATVPLRTAIEGIVVNTDNSDVVAALENLSPDNSDVVSAIQNFSYSALMTKLDAVLTSLQNLTPHNTDVVTAIQNFSYAALMTKIDTAIAAINAKSPILKASVARISEILSVDLPLNTPKKLFSVNTNRIGFCIYNNAPSNSLYFGPTNSPAGARVFGQLGTNAGPTALQFFAGPTVWTGEIWVLRNAGAGSCVGYELEP